MLFITLISVLSTSISVFLMLYGPGFSNRCIYSFPGYLSCKTSSSSSSSSSSWSTCGNQTISYPFWLKSTSSATSRGFQSYELSCVGNRIFLGAPYDNYLVTNISYQDSTIQVVDTDVASGKCNLPSQAMTPIFFPNGYSLPQQQHNNTISKWATFINCSEKIDFLSENSYPYIYPNYYPYPYRAIIPCLSQNNRFIYVVGSDRILYVLSEPKWIKGKLINDVLFTSCTYLTMVPIREDVNLSTVGDDIFQTLKDGFILQWTNKPKVPRFKIIYGCIREALRIVREDMKNTTIFEQIEYPFRYSFWLRDCIYLKHDYVLSIYSEALLVSLYILLINIAVMTTVRLIIAPLCIHVFLFYQLLKILAPKDSVETFLRNNQRLTPTRYAYSDIVAMTRHFKDRLGQGGFGTVYKGELPGGHLLAIKLLGKSNDNGEDFISEVSTIGMIHHTNIVRLVGFCSEGLHRALVYEYMYNGSLDKYIFSSTQKFTTKKLNEIALGVARGIDYLHRGCDMRILHFDIKPSNVLLDGNFNPKVSDFGLAKLYPKDNSLVSTFAARGTIGYMAPELISRSFGHISYKSDVYSFGMLLLEMAGGRRNFDSKAGNSSQAYYPSWIYDRLKQQTNIMEGVNHNIEIEIEDVEKKLCKVGLWCIQMAPSSRPTMMRVLEMLEGDIDDVEMPPKPFFFSSSSQPTTKEHYSYELSFNEISTIYESE